MSVVDPRPPQERVYTTLALLTGQLFEGEWLVLTVSGGPSGQGVAGIVFVDRKSGMIVPFTSALFLTP